jgi:hypothetical protein
VNKTSDLLLEETSDFLEEITSFTSPFKGGGVGKFFIA